MSMTSSKGAVKYKAPALVKGLEILELLAAQEGPITLSGISERLEKSRNEIFRMVQELESLGYISRTSSGDGYQITNKLFLLGLEQPRTKSVIEAALPHMRSFAHMSGQSCHLAVRSDEVIVVVARVEAPGPVSFSVRVGHKQKIASSTSGVVLYTWQADAERTAWLSCIRESDGGFDEKQFLAQSERCRDQGYIQKNSRFVRGVTDLAAPILQKGQAVAALTSPCLSHIDLSAERDLPIALLQRAAEAITNDLAVG